MAEPTVDTNFNPLGPAKGSSLKMGCVLGACRDEDANLLDDSIAALSPDTRPSCVGVDDDGKPPEAEIRPESHQFSQLISEKGQDE
jgi:hypothetical protein